MKKKMAVRRYETIEDRKTRTVCLSFESFFHASYGLCEEHLLVCHGCGLGRQGRMLRRQRRLGLTKERYHRRGASSQGVWKIAGRKWSISERYHLVKSSRMPCWTVNEPGMGGEWE
jgi:hypothetical protein